MNRSPLLFLIPALLLGFLLAGGLGRAIDAKKASERNERVKEINHNVHRGLDASQRLLEIYYTAKARDFVDVPPEWRQRNWSDPTGSCVHATTISLLRWQGLYQEAAEWKRRYGGGESAGPHTRKMKDMGLKYVVTTDSDVRLLEWALATRRGCGVTWPPGHCVALVGKEHGQAVILDNNRVGDYRRVPWSDFLSTWRRAGGWAFAITNGKVPPPVPR